MKKYLEQLEENCRERGGFIALKSKAAMMVFDDDTDAYSVSIEYDTGRYDRNSMEKFFAIYNKTVEALAKIDDPGKVRLSAILDF